LKRDASVHDFDGQMHLDELEDEPADAIAHIRHPKA
jgi:hypothetical protein